MKWLLVMQPVIRPHSTPELFQILRLYHPLTCKLLSDFFLIAIIEVKTILKVDVYDGTKRNWLKPDLIMIYWPILLSELYFEGLNNWIIMNISRGEGWAKQPAGQNITRGEKNYFPVIMALFSTFDKFIANGNVVLYYLSMKVRPDSLLIWISTTSTK